MTDLAPGEATTRACPRCGEQNPIDSTTCLACGATLEEPVGRDAEREDLETIEVERAAAAAGFDSEFAVDGDTLTCPACRSIFTLDDVRVHTAESARDTPTDTADADVVTCTCPHCHTPGHATLGTDARER